MDLRGKREREREKPSIRIDLPQKELTIYRIPSIFEIRILVRIAQIISNPIVGIAPLPGKILRFSILPLSINMLNYGEFCLL